uniref:Uncharacterized protein n=1 Tax=viral metagenome TaxID=1070528 RepID=A0A6C0CHJ8_9ZZZZ
MDIVIKSGLLFGGFTVVGGCIIMAATFMKCGKYNVSSAFQNGAIMGSFPTISFALGSFFEFVRNPFIHFFEGFGIEHEMAIKFGMGYLMMLFIWPATIWGVMNGETAACVATVDEMTAFKTKMLDQLHNKQKAEAKDTAPPPKTS